jgi:hypothetical protein
MQDITGDTSNKYMTKLALEILRASPTPLAYKTSDSQKGILIELYMSTQGAKVQNKLLIPINNIKTAANLTASNGFLILGFIISATFRLTFLT